MTRRHSRARGGAVAALVALIASLVVPLAGVAGAATTLTVQVGGSSADGSVDGQSFYPGMVTIHQGDAIQWKFRGAHTVNFYTPPGDPEAPGVGDGTFNGVNDPESSGIKFPAPGGDTYQLTFASTGNFVYFCALHPGMQGLVQVVAADSATPVTTQAQADQLGASQLAADLAAGAAAVNAYKPTSSPGANGTTTYDAANGIGDPQAATVQLAPSTTTGTAQGTATFAVQGDKLHVDVTMTGLAPGDHLTHIHSGQCGASSPPKGAANDVLFSLPNLVADASGNAHEVADLPLTGPPVIPSNSWYLNIHASGTDLTPVSCGNVVSHPASSLRFYPATLTIKAGDTVKWTMMDVHEVHPLYFGPADKAPPNPFSDASGGNSVSSPDQQVLSGPQFPGQTFSLTFTAPGTYTYMCTLHADLGMRGTVQVLGTSVTRPQTGTLARTGTSPQRPIGLAGGLVLGGVLLLLGERRWRRRSIRA